MARFAIYFVPEPETPLARFGAHAIGYDVECGADVAFHDHPFYRHDDAGAWTESPRRYGFHATLKAPFELAGGEAPEALLAEAAGFAAGHRPVDLGRLEVTAIGRFVALTVRDDAAAVDALAAAAVRSFEPLRAPLSAADRERRLAANLTERQRAYVDQWGYPHVFEEFRFHMTLTGRLADSAMVAGAVDALGEIYQAVDEPQRITSIAVVEQADRQARFRVRARFALAGT